MADDYKIRITADMGGFDPNFGIAYHNKRMLQLVSQKRPEQLAFGRSIIFNAFADDLFDPIAGAHLQIMYDFGVTELGWVDPEYSSQGIGRLLYEALEAFAIKSGCRRLIASSIGFYESEGYIKKMGFEIFARLNDCPTGSELIYYHKRLP